MNQCTGCDIDFGESDSKAGGQTPHILGRGIGMRLFGNLSIMRAHGTLQPGPSLLQAVPRKTSCLQQVPLTESPSCARLAESLTATKRGALAFWDEALAINTQRCLVSVCSSAVPVKASQHLSNPLGPQGSVPCQSPWPRPGSDVFKLRCCGWSQFLQCSGPHSLGKRIRAFLATGGGPHGCFHKLGVYSVGVFMTRALPCGVCIGACPDFGNSHHCKSTSAQNH